MMALCNSNLDVCNTLLPTQNPFSLLLLLMCKISLHIGVQCKSVSFVLRHADFQRDGLRVPPNLIPFCTRQIIGQLPYFGFNGDEGLLQSSRDLKHLLHTVPSGPAVADDSFSDSSTCLYGCAYYKFGKLSASHAINPFSIFRQLSVFCL